MSDKVFLGNNVEDIDFGHTQTISRVNVVVDGEHTYTSGNDTGRVVEVACPWGTQSMADDILSKVSSVDYQPYNATNALLDPATEIGDGITVSGIYSEIANANITLDRMLLSEISAPGTDEIEDEYPYKSKSARSFEAKLAYTRSLITKTADEIRLAVEASDGRISDLTINLDGISTRVQDAEGNISNLKQTASSLEASIESVEGDITSINIRAGSIETNLENAQGDITRIDAKAGSLEASVESAESKLSQTLKMDPSGIYITNAEGSILTINGGQIDADTISVNAANINGTLTFGQLPDSTAKTWQIPTNTSDLYNDSGFQDYQGVTTITQDAIATANIYANQIISGQINAGEVTLGNAGGGFQVGYGTDSSGYGTYGAMMYGQGGGSYCIATNAGCRMQSSGNFIVVTPYGLFSNKTLTMDSDRRLKHDISEDFSKLSEFYKKLTPVSFIYNNDEQEQTHIGFVAQDVKSALSSSGIVPSSFSGYVEFPGPKFDDQCAINYNEFIGLNTYMIQNLMKRVEALEDRK